MKSSEIANEKSNLISNHLGEISDNLEAIYLRIRKWLNLERFFIPNYEKYAMSLYRGDIIHSFTLILIFQVLYLIVTGHVRTSFALVILLLLHSLEVPHCELFTFENVDVLDPHMGYVTNKMVAKKTNFYRFCRAALWLEVSIVLGSINFDIYMSTIFHYYCAWYTMISFRRIILLEKHNRGIFYDTSEKHWWSRKQSIIQKQIYKAVMMNDIDELKHYLNLGLKLGGSEFSIKWYTANSYLFHYLSWTNYNPLHSACQLGNLKIVKMLLSTGFHVHEFDVIPDPISLRAGDFTTRFLQYWGASQDMGLYKSSDANVPDGSKFFSKTLFTPLHIAAIYGHDDIVEELIQHGAKVNVSAKSTKACHRTPVLYWTSCKKCALAILQAGCNILHLQNSKYTSTVYESAMVLEKYDIARMYLEFGGDVPTSKLHTCAGNGNILEMKVILQLQVNPDTISSVSQRTPLFWAVIAGQLNAVELLCKHKVNVNHQDAFGITPLAWACLYNRTKIASILLKHNADPNIVDKQGRNALLFAVEQNMIREDTMKILVHLNFDTAIVHSGDTALHLAIRNSNLQVALALVKNGSSISIVNASNKRPVDETSNAEFLFAIKAAAGQRDVMISYSHRRLDFANKIRNQLEQHHFTTWFDLNTDIKSGIMGGTEWRNEIGFGIQNASVILCILTPEYVKSQWCLKELAFAKQCNVPVLAIQAVENLELSKELEFHLYKRQFISMHNPNTFDIDFTNLRDALHETIATGKIPPAFISSPSRTSTQPLPGTISKFLYVAHAECHNTFCDQLASSLLHYNIVCYLNKNDPRFNFNSSQEAIEASTGLLVLLSNETTSSEIVSDELAYAEDKNVPIYPIVYSSPKIGISHQFTFSRTEKFYFFAQNIAYDQSLHKLVQDLT